MSIKYIFIGIVVTSIIVILSYSTGYHSGQKSIKHTVDTATIVKHDTIWTPSKPVFIEKPVIVRDTTIIYKSTNVESGVARLDTAVTEGDILVDYYVAPSLFRLQWFPRPISHVVDSVLVKYPIPVPTPLKWYNKPTNTILPSLAIGVVVGIIAAKK